MEVDRHGNPKPVTRAYLSQGEWYYKGRKVSELNSNNVGTCQCGGVLYRLNWASNACEDCGRTYSRELRPQLQADLQESGEHPDDESLEMDCGV